MAIGHPKFFNFSKPPLFAKHYTHSDMTDDEWLHK